MIPEGVIDVTEFGLSIGGDGRHPELPSEVACDRRGQICPVLAVPVFVKHRYIRGVWNNTMPLPTISDITNSPVDKLLISLNRIKSFAFEPEPELYLLLALIQLRIRW